MRLSCYIEKIEKNYCYYKFKIIKKKWGIALLLEKSL